MKRRALLESFAAHMAVLFFLVVLVTFVRKDFDLKVTLVVAAAYLTSVSVFFILLIALLEKRESERLRERTQRRPESPSGDIQYWLLVVVYIGLIFTLSSISDLPFISAIQEMDPRKFSLHILEYLGLGFLMYRAFLNSGAGKYKSIFLTIGVCLAVAYLDETYQLSIPGRRFNIYDFYSDGLGAALGTAAAVLLKGRRRRGRAKT